MNQERLIQLADSFFTRTMFTPGMGRITSINEFDGINSKVLRRIPGWYKHLITRYPLVELEIGIPNDHGDEELKGTPFEQLPLMAFSFVSVKDMEENALKYFPGYSLLKKGYIKIAEDRFVTQEGIYINSDDKDPPVLLAFHDMGNKASEIIKYSEKLLDHFGDIFIYGKRFIREIN